MSPRQDLEDWLTELPPLDGGEDDVEEQGPDDDFVPEDSGDASLDDANADDLDVDDGVDIVDEPSAQEDDEGWEADVGEPELDLTDDEAGASESDGAATDVDGPATTDGDLDIDPDLPASDDDAGEEGTTDPIEHSLDEDLPALDADEEGDFEDTLLSEVGIAAGPRAGLPWADVLWEERSSRELAWPIDVEDVTAMAVVTAGSSETVAAIAGGEVRVATLGMPLARSGSKARPPFDGSEMLLALTGGASPTLWLCTREGDLVRSADLGASFTRAPGLGRSVAAVGAREDGSISVLAAKGGSAELLTSADGTRWFAQRILIDVHPASAGRGVWIAHRGPAIAIGDANGVSLSRDGRHFVRIPSSAGAACGAFAGRTADAPLLIAGEFAETEGGVHLVRVASDGTSEILGELKLPLGVDDAVEEPNPFALFWHEASETLAVVFPTHVSTWGAAERVKK
jgi:hypothetical protein